MVSESIFRIDTGKPTTPLGVGVKGGDGSNLRNSTLKPH